MSHRSISYTVVLITTCLLFTATGLCQGIATRFGAPPHEAVLSDEARLHIALTSLIEAINNPNPATLDVLRPVIATPDIEVALEKVSHFSAVKDRLLSRSNSVVNQRLGLRSPVVNPDRAGYSVTATVDFEVNRHIFTSAVTIQFEKRRWWTITNFDEVITHLNDFIDRGQTKSLPFAAIEDPTQPVSRVASSTETLSEHMLCPATFDLVHDCISAASSRDIFDDHVLFSQPHGIFAWVYDDIGTAFDHTFLVVTDPGWNRIVSLDLPQEWIVHFGSTGNGALQFRRPLAVDLMAWEWLIGDTYNNRVSLYSFEETTGEMVEHDKDIYGDFDMVADVAAALIYSSTPTVWPEWEFAVLDMGNSKVNIYSEGGQLQSSYFSRGCYSDQLLNPTSLCYAINKNTQYPYRRIIVADAGNNRVIYKQTTSPYNFVSTPEGLFPADAYLSSVTVDNFGYVYVTDTKNCKVYLLDTQLQTIIASYGTCESGIGQLNKPRCFEIAHGTRYVDDTTSVGLVLGDAFASEHFSNTSGVKKYVLGNDILWHQMTYIPQPCEGCYDFVDLEWYQSGTTESWRKTYWRGFQQEDIHQDLNFPGTQIHRLELPWDDETDSGWVKFEITTASIYSASITSSIIDSLWVNRYIDTSWTIPRIVVEDYGIEDISGDLPATCITVDSTKLWKAWINAYDCWYDTTVIHYLWAYVGQVDYALFSGQRSIFTSADFVYVTFVDSPGPCEDSCLLFSVKMVDANGEALIPCGPQRHDCDWQQDFYYPFYDDFSQSPCAPPPPPPTGACCLPDSICMTVTEATCSINGGTYQGDSTVCEPYPCPIYCCVVRGDFDHSGGIDISDVTSYNDYFFGGGPDPACFDEGDVNADGGLDISDYTFLLDYMFGGGPPPPPCDLLRAVPTNEATEPASPLKRDIPLKSGTQEVEATE